MLVVGQPRTSGNTVFKPPRLFRSCLQLAAVCKQLRETPFVDAVTPAMQQQLQQVLAGDGSEAATVCWQLAQQLGLSSTSSIWKEQEALALERRKAVEGRDAKQASTIDQVGRREAWIR